MNRRKERARAAEASVYLASLIDVMDEEHFNEIDAAILYIEEARARTERAKSALRSVGAPDHLVQALASTERALSDSRRELMHRTLYAAEPAAAS
jgi:hypothetical protein